MELCDAIILAVVDKLLIAVIVLLVGFWLNRKLERFKGGLSFQTALAPNRTQAYQGLWAMTEPLSPRDIKSLDVSVAKGRSLQQLRDWYYKNGNAMYLSLDAADLFLRGLQLLERPAVSAKEIKDHFSSLRTQLKVDLGIYGRSEARIKLPRSG